jgi:phosphate starvation-inducible protein PhoH and related proteins
MADQTSSTEPAASQERAAFTEPLSTAIAEPIRVLVPGTHLLVNVLGNRDEHLRLVERSFPAAVISARGNEFTISGPDAHDAATVLQELVLLVSKGEHLDQVTVLRAIDMVRDHERPSQVLTTEVMKAGRGKSIRPKTAGQKRYAEAIANNIITVGIGPAGSGKSYLAVALAVQALHAKQVSRIILTRPAVEAGEKLGFLPGDLMAKIDPYLRPLYDALYDMLEPEGTVKLIEKGTIEVAPLAFMRGRTLNNSFIILDEAQNTTPEQMKMFLTRIGFGSKAVITGDVTQVDLKGDKSGLVGLERILGVIDGLEFVHLDRRDVVRHRIVADIVDAYERAEGRF